MYRLAPSDVLSVMMPAVSLTPSLSSADQMPLPNFARLQAAAGQASALLKVLSHPDRLLLLCQLSQGEYCVSELEALIGLGQPSLSQQLGVLRQEGLVSTRRAGKQIYYQIASEDALAVLQVMYQRFCPDDL